MSLRSQDVGANCYPAPPLKGPTEKGLLQYGRKEIDNEEDETKDNLLINRYLLNLKAGIRFLHVSNIQGFLFHFSKKRESFDKDKKNLFMFQCLFLFL